MNTKNEILVAAGLLLGAGMAHAQQPAFQPRMGEPLRGLDAVQLTRFFDGLIEFDLILGGRDGLGPIFNDNGCSLCHADPAIGGFGTKTVTRFGVKASGPNPFDPLDGTGPSGLDLGGTLLQKSALAIDPSCLEVVPPEADIVVSRITPHTFGAGLVEAIDDQDIKDLELNPPDPQVSGMVRPVTPVEGGPSRPGRFGWKGGVATVLTFSADASLNEMGLTNRFFLNENAPNGDTSLLGLCDPVADPEDFPDPVTGLERIDRQTDFQRFLAPPPQTPRSGMAGEAVFDGIGCSACHVSTFTTVGTVESPLADVTIQPYSDFLLHDMGLDRLQGGDGCGDGIVDGIALEQEMMTRALWGLGQRQALLHDGRATGGTFEGNVDAAVQDHGGEAAFARANYNALSPGDRDALYAFLLSLGRVEFDWDNDNAVDVFDWFFLEQHFSGPDPTPPITPDDEGAIADIDQDQDFDALDMLVMQRAFTGQ